MASWWSSASLMLMLLWSAALSVGPQLGQARQTPSCQEYAQISCYLGRNQSQCHPDQLVLNCETGKPVRRQAGRMEDEEDSDEGQDTPQSPAQEGREKTESRREDGRIPLSCQVVVESQQVVLDYLQPKASGLYTLDYPRADLLDPGVLEFLFERFQSVQVNVHVGHIGHNATRMGSGSSSGGGERNRRREFSFNAHGVVRYDPLFPIRARLSRPPTVMFRKYPGFRPREQTSTPSGPSASTLLQSVSMQFCKLIRPFQVNESLVAMVTHNRNADLIICQSKTRLNEDKAPVKPIVSFYWLGESSSATNALMRENVNCPSKGEKDFDCYLDSTTGNVMIKTSVLADAEPCCHINEADVRKQFDDSDKGPYSLCSGSQTLQVVSRALSLVAFCLALSVI